MNTQELYEQWRKQIEEAAHRAGRDEGHRAGRDEGITRGLQRGLLVAYKARFGAVPEDLIEAIERTSDSDTLCGWHSLVTTGTASEVCAHVLDRSARARKG